MDTQFSEKVGYIFLCSDKTEIECFKKNLVGGKEAYLKHVQDMKPGDYIFLYNYQQKKLSGIFMATSSVEKDLEPMAWNRQFPWQARFEKVHTYPPLFYDQLIDVIAFKGLKKLPQVKVSTDQIDQLETLFKSKKRYTPYNDSAIIPTKDGHRVRSEGERLISDWLFEHFITYAYEAQLPEAKMCDFYIPLKSGGGIYIEFWGMDSEEYLENKRIKLDIYKTHNLALIEIKPKHLKNLNQFLLEKLKPHSLL